MGSPPLRHRLARLDLVAHGDHRGGGRADEDDAAVGAHLGEAGVLGEEAIAGVDGVAVGEQRRADDVGDVEVALAAGGGADADLLVGHAHWQRVLVGLGVRDDRAHAHLATATNHPQRDLAAIGDQYLLEHPACRLTFE